jgi:hypothetical protein
MRIMSSLRNSGRSADRSRVSQPRCVAALGQTIGEAVNDEAGRAKPPTWAGGRMGRLPSGRHEQLCVRLSTAEMQELRRRATAAGVSPQRYLLEASLGGGRIPVADRGRRIDEFTHARRQLAGLATNINQLARAGNATGHIPAGTERAIRDIARVLDLLTRATERVAGTYETSGE